ncbi:MAG TPA: deoxyribodipyrimidine photo-lyase [Polyangiaceae bacterium]|jgi:deoxyribodipyrimidine photo-lyase|nr:deoxyribodipyrimidine photo-lyase [Polyangiaceae bacterium]
MVDPLSFGPADPRLRRLNDKPVATRGDFVVYWMQVFRRADDNAALAFAVERANELGVPCLVYEALRPDYPHASDRLHRFVLEGARDTAQGLAERGLSHAFFLPRTADEARGVALKLASRARLLVSDDFPSFVVRTHNAKMAERAPCAFFVVDDCAVVPTALTAKAEIGARTLRPKVTRALDAWLRPIAEPTPAVRPPPRIDLPFTPVDLTTADGPALDALLQSCAIDHAVPPVDATPGGSREAERRLAAFVRGPLATYDADHNDPSRQADSGLSPYLHFGMVSARRVALEARTWGRGAGLEAFLEQLIVRRALSFNFARSRPDHPEWTALPAWARATLEKHAADGRYEEMSLADLEAARSPDELWNAAMNELRARGVIQSYARMLWGKLPLLWMRRPEQAHAAMVHLNDKWALDGRDPNGYANVSWCFGLHDRPWPERAVFGTVRSMTSASARRKLDFEDYIERWNVRPGLK